MRRTLLSVLVAVVAFVVTAFVLVVGYAIVAGRSMGPSQGVRTPVVAPHGAQPPSASPRANASSSPSAPTEADAAGSPSPDASSSAPAGSSAASTSDHTAGLLSQDFRKLGLDDPSTPLIDESLRSACGVAGGTIAGPALCDGR